MPAIPFISPSNPLEFIVLMLLSLVHCAIALLSSALQSQQQHALGEGGFSKGGLSAEKPKLILG